MYAHVHVRTHVVKCQCTRDPTSRLARFHSSAPTCLMPLTLARVVEEEADNMRRPAITLLLITLPPPPPLPPAPALPPLPLPLLPLLPRWSLVVVVVLPPPPATVVCSR